MDNSLLSSLLSDSQPGFFGKVRSHGDFVSRRLPATFTEPWDKWLQTLLHVSREQLGPLWLESYLNSPIWRFALAPGACSTQAWAGILMPSIDKVGRHFPLTIASRISNSTTLIKLTAETNAWFDQLEALALSALRNDFVLINFDSTLIQTTTPRMFAESENGLSNFVNKQGHSDIPEKLDTFQETTPQLSPNVKVALPSNHSLWWINGSQQTAPCVMVYEGLPTATSFQAMLNC